MSTQKAGIRLGEVELAGSRKMANTPDGQRVTAGFEFSRMSRQSEKKAES